ncbi:hypothetical protein CHUAL_011511 [Chamberlinius hualienensis]
MADMESADAVGGEIISENWERFMLFWGTIPEVLIGSCILSIFAIVGTIILSKFSSYGNKATELMENNRHQKDHGSSGLNVPSARSEIPPKFKTKYTRAAEKVEASLSKKELAQEKQLQREQLKEIFELMKKKGDEFGMTDVSQMEEQMKLYI